MIAVSFIGLLVVVGIFTLCVVATIRMKSVWPVAIIGSLLLVCVLFLFAFRVSTVQRQEAIVEEAQNRAQIHQFGTPGHKTSWSAIDTKQFRTNIFPSATSAATDLAKQVPAILEQMYGDSGDLTEFKIQVTILSKTANETFQDELLKQLPNTTFGTFEETNDVQKNETDTDTSKTDTSKTDTSKNVHIKLLLTGLGSTTSAWDPPRHTDTGTLSCKIISDQGSRSIRADYIEKPWVEQLDQFSNAYPSRGFAVGVSTTLCESPEAANQSALQSLKAIETHTAINGIKVATPVDNSHVIDRFVQKLERPYGDVWREAVLIDYKGPQIERTRANMVANAATQIQAEQTHASRSRFNVLILIAVFAVTALIGTVLNLVTEGYLRGKIAATVTAFVIAATIAFFFKTPW